MRRVFLVVSFLSLILGVNSCTKKDSDKAPHLVAYVSLEEEIAQNLLAQFQKETGIAVDFVRLSTGEATARLEAEKNNPQASIWLGGVGLGHAEMKEKGLTTPYQSPATASLEAKYKDPEGYWNGIYLGSLVFATNRELLQKKGLKAPTTWTELLDPKWKGQIQLPNPGTSGTSYNIIAALVTDKGEEKAFDYLKQLHRNVSQYTRSGAAPAKNVALGEALVGVGYVHDLLKLVHVSKASLDIVYPKDGTGYEVASVSLIKGGKQTELAKKLIDWVYTTSASQVLADNFVTPLKRDGVKLRPEMVIPDGVRLVDVPIDWAGKNKTRLIEMWNEKVNGQSLS